MNQLSIAIVMMMPGDDLGDDRNVMGMMIMIGCHCGHACGENGHGNDDTDILMITTSAVRDAANESAQQGAEHDKPRKYLQVP